MKFQKGHIPHNKGLIIKLKCKHCHKTFYRSKAYLKSAPGNYCSRSCTQKEIHKASKNPRWKGGITYIRGYKYILAPPEHPYQTRHGYISESRFIMEKKLNRYLTPNEIIHHINGNKLDNRPENLIVLTRKFHGQLHNSGYKNNPIQFLELRNKQWLMKQKQTMSQQQIADFLGCSHSLVWRWQKNLTLNN